MWPVPTKWVLTRWGQYKLEAKKWGTINFYVLRTSPLDPPDFNRPSLSFFLLLRNKFDQISIKLSTFYYSSYQYLSQQWHDTNRLGTHFERTVHTSAAKFDRTQCPLANKHALCTHSTTENSHKAALSKSTTHWNDTLGSQSMGGSFTLPIP